jgi:hypothetical protein
MLTEEMCKYASYDAAAMVIEEIKKNCPVSHDSGNDLHLVDAFILTPFENKNGFISAKVTVVGYDERGVPQMLKARAIESGTTKSGKNGFIRKSVNAVKAKAQASMRANIDKYISKIKKS